MPKGYASNGSNIWMPEIPGGIGQWASATPGQATNGLPQDYNPYTDPGYEDRDKEFLNNYFSSVEEDQDLLALLPDLDYATYGANIGNDRYFAAMAEDESLYRRLGSEGASFDRNNILTVDGVKIMGGTLRANYGININDYISLDRKKGNTITDKEGLLKEFREANVIADKTTGKLVNLDTDLKSANFAKTVQNMGVSEFRSSMGDTSKFDELVQDSQGYQDYLGGMASKAKSGMLEDFTDIISSTDSMFTNTIDYSSDNPVFTDEEEDPLGAIV